LQKKTIMISTLIVKDWERNVLLWKKTAGNLKI